MEALILAGGFGTRLKGSIGNEIPKPLAPIQGIPFLQLLIQYLSKSGITSLILSTHHLKEKIREVIGNEYCGIPIIYAEEPVPLGTGGAILYALSFRKEKGPLFIFNGDSFAPLDLASMWEIHNNEKRIVTMALYKVLNCSRYGEVVVNDQHIITNFIYPGRNSPGLINAGCYLFTPEEHFLSLKEVFSFEKDYLFIYQTLLHFRAFYCNDYFIDIGVPEDYKRAQHEILDFIKKL